MTRRGFLAASLAAGMGALVGCGAPSARRRPRRNVVFIISDTLRADQLGGYGALSCVSPQVDLLARRGVLFENVMSAAPLTASSHATIMTGTYPTRHGILGNAGGIPDDLVTLAEAYRKAGYQTAAFVSSWVLRPDVLHGIMRGFCYYDVSLPDPPHKGDAWYRDAAFTTDVALRWLRRRATEPFCLWLHYFEPHGPYAVPNPRLLERAGGLPRRPGEPMALPVMAEPIGKGGIPPKQTLGGERDPVYYREHYAARYGHADEQIGRVVNEVRKLGLEDDTVIAFTSDHGELLGEHGYYFQHGVTLLNAVIHVPLIIAGPGIEAGRRVSALAGNTDIMPTLLALSGVDAGWFSSQLQGESLAPAMQGKSVEPTPRYSFSKQSSQRCAILGAHKYTEPMASMPGPGRLVDFAADPTETKDLATAQPETAAKLREALRCVVQESGSQAGRTSSAPPLSEENRRRLKSLGYVE